MLRWLTVLLIATALAAPAQAETDTVGLYGTLCASCHGAARYGGYAPPLLPDALKRKVDDDLVRVILDGRPNTQMPPFADQLAEAQARQLVALFREPVGEIRWGVEEIRASRVVLEPDGPALDPSVRRENLTLVVERGAGAVVVLDGDKMTELDRFPVGRVHGGPKFDAALSKVWSITRDGTVVTYDIDAGGLRSKVKAAVNGRNIAVNRGGDLVAVTSQLPAQVVVLDGDLQPRVVLPLDGQPSGVYQVPGEARFVLTLRDLPRLLLIDQKTLEMTARELPEPFEDFVFVPGQRKLLASSRAGSRILLYDLDTSTVEATLETEALPHLFSACFFEREGVLHAALNHIGAPGLTVVRVDGLSVQATVPLAGSGYFARTHEGTPFIWVDTNTEQIQLVDKRTLTLVPDALIPAPGRKAMHVEFTDDGSRALVSVWDQDGAVVVYDAISATEALRIPYSMPIGKYNARNKTLHFRQDQ